MGTSSSTRPGIWIGVRNGCTTSAPLTLVLSMLLAGMPASSHAQIIIGPYEFADEAPFADTAYFHPNPAHTTEVDYLNHWSPPFPPGWPEVQAGEWMLVGYSPDTRLINLGADTLHPCDWAAPYHGRELLDFLFVDVVAENGPGGDIVIFDSQPQGNNYEVAVRPRGASLTHFVWYPLSESVRTGPAGDVPSHVSAMEIDLSRYGIPPGIAVDMIQLAGDRYTADRCAHPDPVMAAVLNPLCACDDGDPCTWDCDDAGNCVSSPHDPGTPCSGGVCDGKPTPACVECLEDAHCPSARPRCDVATNLCVGCTDDAHCEDLNECTTDTCSSDGSCENVSVEAGAPCGDGGVCDGAPMPLCAECVEDTHCEQRECMISQCEEGRCLAEPAPRGTACEGGLCNGSRTAPECVSCTADRDCDADTPFCTPSGLCAECRRGSDCSDICMTDPMCVDGMCRGTAHSPGTPCAGGFCNLEMPPACVPCLVDMHCDDGDPRTRDVCDDTCRHEPLGTALDGGPAIPPARDGCSCRAGGRRSASPAWLAAALVIFVWRRRRRAL